MLAAASTGLFFLSRFCAKELFTSPQIVLLSLTGSHGAGDRVASRTRLPPCQMKTLIVETAPPIEKSETSSRSPSVWWPTKVPVAVQAGLQIGRASCRERV